MPTNNKPAKRFPDPVAAIAMLVDAPWYAQRHPEVAAAEAVRHFAESGLA